MEKSEINKIAKQLAACEYILQTSDSQEDKDKAIEMIVQLAFTIPDLEALAEIDKKASAILDGKLVL